LGRHFRQTADRDRTENIATGDIAKQYFIFLFYISYLFQIESIFLHFCGYARNSVTEDRADKSHAFFM